MRCELVFFLELLLLRDSDLVDWCQDKQSCRWARLKHLRCVFKEVNMTAQCPNIKSVITPEDRKWILHYHNVFRNDVAEGRRRWAAGKVLIRGWEVFSTTVGDMRQMLWDYDLEDNARIYASQCNVNAYWPYQCAHTEKIAMAHMSKFDHQTEKLYMHNVFEHFVKGKNSIHFYYSDYLLARSYIPGPWDDFFATIISQTVKLGCAKVLCGCNQIKPLYETGSVVCIYGPSPNFISGGFSIFERAKPCQKCPPRTGCKKDSKYKFLCATEKDPARPENIPPRDGGTKLIHSTLLQFLLIKFLVIVISVLK